VQRENTFFILFFGGAAFANGGVASMPAASRIRVPEGSRRRAAEKQKADFGSSPGYRQATPTGFRLQTPVAELRSTY